MSRAVENWPGSVRPWGFRKLDCDMPRERAVRFISPAKASLDPEMSRARARAISFPLLTRRALTSASRVYVSPALM